MLPAPLLERITNDKYMNYKEQMTDWLAKHPDATLSEAWEAGYLTSTDNWCNCRR